MYFRTTYLVQHLRIRSARGDAFQSYEESELVLHHRGPPEVVLRLRNPTEEEISSGYSRENLFCVASTKRDPNDSVYAMYRSLSEGELPEESVLPEQNWRKHHYIDEDGALKRTPPLDWFSRRFQDFYHTVNRDLTQAVRQAASMLRWRGAIKGPHNPFSTKGLQWSLDGEKWHRYNDLKAELGRVESATVHVNERLQADVEMLFAEQTTEPIGHELFREAWTLLHQRNERSALVIGIAALEAGFKEFVGDLVPDARWLNENLPTPPVDKMLRDYLPLLPTRHTIDGKVLAPPEEILRTLKNAIALRNTLAHVGRASVHRDKVREMLCAVDDVLWLLDYYRGFEWAFNHVSDETKQRIIGA